MTPGHMTKTYNSWRGMIQRCTNPRATNYPRYGGRGIAVCNRWLTFALFLEDMGERPDGASLDRINRDRDYELTNCRWATPIKQANNSCRNRLLEHDGRVMSVMEWAKELGMYPNTIYQRIYRGTPVDSVLCAPTRRRKTA